MEENDNLEIKDILKSEIIEEHEKKKKKEKDNNQEKKGNLKEQNPKEKHKKKQGNMNFLEIEKEDAINQVLYISPNNNYNYLCLGTLTGFKIFSLLVKPIELIYHFQFNPIEPVKIIEMVETSQLLILVGQKESNNLSPKKLTLFDLGSKKVIYSLNPYNAEIKLVRLNKKRLIAYADKTIFIYNIQNMKLLHTIEFDEDIINAEKTFYQGQICLSPNSEKNNYLIYSFSQSHGLLKIYDALYLTYVNFIQAHKSPLFKISINSNGDLLASCSKSNGSIKIFKIPSGEKIFKFKRVYTSNTITGMNFNILGSNKLIVSSSSSNIHIFDLEKTNKTIVQDNNIKNDGYINQINKIYQKVAKECKEYLNNKNLTTTVNIKDLKGDNILLFRENKEKDDKKIINVIAITTEGFFLSIDISTETYNIINTYIKYIDSLKLKK
jgi:WD40 repeat protein